MLSAAQMVDRVPNGPLRDAYLRRSTDILQADVARAAGWERGDQADHPNGLADITTIKRLLGIAPFHSYHGGKRYTSYRKTIAYDDAVRLVLALGLDPVTYGV
jgi:hypothetical protein